MPPSITSYKLGPEGMGDITQKHIFLVPVPRAFSHSLLNLSPLTPPLSRNSTASTLTRSFLSTPSLLVFVARVCVHHVVVARARRCVRIAMNAIGEWPRKCPHAICAAPLGKCGLGYQESAWRKHLKRSHKTRCNNLGCAECLRGLLKQDLGSVLGKRRQDCFRIPSAGPAACKEDET